jgi:antitoxin ParD1/3/4
MAAERNGLSKHQNEHGKVRRSNELIEVRMPSQFSLALLSGSTIEQWLRDKVVVGHAEYLADPSKGIPGDKVMDRIRSRREAGLRSKTV